MGRLAGLDVVVDPDDIELDPASQTVAAEDRTARANLKLLREYAARTERTVPRRLVLRSWPHRSRSSGGGAGSRPCGVERHELVVDAYGGLRSKGRGRDPSRIERALRRRGIDYPTYQGWRVLDSYELALGAGRGTAGQDHHRPGDAGDHHQGRR